jgi:hypothetical protein
LIAKNLLKKCDNLYIIVPFREQKPLVSEHVNIYAQDYFQALGNYDYKIFTSKGWSQFGVNLYYNVYFKNIFRLIIGRSIIKRAKQIIFIFSKS